MGLHLWPITINWQDIIQRSIEEMHQLLLLESTKTAVEYIFELLVTIYW